MVPSWREPELDVLHLPATVRHGDHVLGAGLDPLHRPVRARSATRTATMSSGAQCLAPNEPPTCGAISRTLVGLDAEVAGERSRGSMCGIWHAEVHGELVAVAVVARDDRDRRALHRHDRDPLVLEAPAHDHVGARERVEVVGFARPSRRWTRSPRTAAARRARARAPCRRPRGAGRSRRSRPRRRRPPAPWSRPTTTATVSPTKRTWSCASAGRIAAGLSCIMPVWSGKSRSSAVYTPTTPGIARARRSCRCRASSACATGERTNARCSTPGEVEVVDVGALAPQQRRGPRPGARGRRRASRRRTWWRSSVRLPCGDGRERAAARAPARGGGGTRATR